MIIIKFLLIFFLLLLLFRMGIRWAGKKVLQSVQKEMNKQKRQANTTKKKKKPIQPSTDSIGEYIDYEEIKEQ